MKMQVAYPKEAWGGRHKDCPAPVGWEVRRWGMRPQPGSWKIIFFPAMDLLRQKLLEDTAMVGPDQCEEQPTIRAI